MRPLALGAASLLTLAALAPTALAAEPPEGEVIMDTKTAPPAAPEREIPAYPPPSARWWTMTVGLGASAFFYGAAAGMSYAFPNAPGSPELRTPVVGPWLSIANDGCRPDDLDCSTLLVVGRSLLKAIDGLAQFGGILVIIEGAFMPTQYVPDTPASKRPTKPSNAPSSPTDPKDKPSEKNLFFLPTPMNVGERGIGIGVVGRF